MKEEKERNIERKRLENKLLLMSSTLNLDQKDKIETDDEEMI